MPRVSDPPDPKTIELPGGPRAGESIPDDPIDGVDFETFVKISAELAEGTPPRAAILRAVGLDDLRWAFIEQGFMMRVATAALRGETRLANELDRLFIEAQDSLGPTEPTHGLDRFAFLMAHVELGTPLAPILKSQGLTLAGFARLQRAWMRRLAADDALTRTFREWVLRAKSEQAIS